MDSAIFVQSEASCFPLFPCAMPGETAAGGITLYLPSRLKSGVNLFSFSICKKVHKVFKQSL